MLDFASLGKGKHAVNVSGCLLKVEGVKVWRSEYSVEGVTDEFTEVKPTSPEQRKVDANTAAQIRSGALESFDV